MDLERFLAVGFATGAVMEDMRGGALGLGRGCTALKCCCGIDPKSDAGSSESPKGYTVLRDSGRSRAPHLDVPSDSDIPSC